MSQKSLNTKISTLASTSDKDSPDSEVSPCLDHLYAPHGRYLGQGLQCLGKGVLIRAGRATTSYLTKVTVGAQAVAIVSKIWKIWDGFHKELYLYGHPLHLRPLQGFCVPSIIGVFNTSEGLANMAMEPPHPHAWRVADRSLSTNEKRVIVEAYAQIHARGVLHRDVALRHMLIGRDGKATIINFRQASCLPPVKKIGLSGCGAHEFQLEMRRVKFLLDYQGAREFEYRLAKEHCYAMRTSSTVKITSGALFPISVVTLRRWDASTLEDLHSPPLPLSVPNSPSISLHPITWTQEEWPSKMDDLGHGYLVKEQALVEPSPEISLIHRSSDLADDDDSQGQASRLLRFANRKRKPIKCDIDLDRASEVPSKRTRRIVTKERSSGAHHRQVISVAEHSIHDPPPDSGYIVVSCSAPDVPVLSYPGVPPPMNTSVSRYHPSGGASLENQSEHSLPESLTASLAASIHAPLPNYSPSGARPRSAGSDAPFRPFLDDISDSSSDSSFASDDSSCGSWAYSEPLEPNSPAGAFVILHDGPSQIPNSDISDPPFIFGHSADADINPNRHPRLERSQLSFERSESIFDKCRRKRLFTNSEEENEERPRKRRGIERSHME